MEIDRTINRSTLYYLKLMNCAKPKFKTMVLMSPRKSVESSVMHCIPEGDRGRVVKARFLKAQFNIC